MGDISSSCYFVDLLLICSSYLLSFGCVFVAQLDRALACEVSGRKFDSFQTQAILFCYSFWFLFILSYVLSWEVFLLPLRFGL